MTPEKLLLVETRPDAPAPKKTSLHRLPSESNTVSISTSQPLHMPEILLLDRRIPALLRRTTDILRESQLIILAIPVMLAIPDRIILALVLEILATLDHARTLGQTTEIE